MSRTGSVRGDASGSGGHLAREHRVVAARDRAPRRADESGPSWPSRRYAGTGRARHTVCDSLQGLRRPTRSDRGFPRSAEMAEASVSWSETECLLDARREAGPGMPLDSRSRAGLRFWWNLVGPCAQGVTRIERQVFAGADEGCTVHTARISAQRRAGVLTARRCSPSHGRHVPLSDSFSRGGVSACAAR